MASLAMCKDSIRVCFLGQLFQYKAAHAWKNERTARMHAIVVVVVVCFRVKMIVVFAREILFSLGLSHASSGRRYWSAML